MLRSYPPLSDGKLGSSVHSPQWGDPKVILGKLRGHAQRLVAYLALLIRLVRPDSQEVGTDVGSMMPVLRR